MKGSLIVAVLVLCIGTALSFLPAVEAASLRENILAVDKAFDKNGDGLVEASDWKLMSGAERKAYARRSVEAVGGHPDTDAGNGQTLAQYYLSVLERIYAP